MIAFHFLGHAGVKLTSHGQSLVIDPWFGRPLQGDNLVAYPPIPQLSAVDLADTAAIHVSHIHKDHFCAEGLSRFARSTPVVVGHYPQPALLQAARQLGFTDVREIPDEGLELGPFRLHNVPFTPFDGSFDSLLIVEAEGRTILLNNDCILSDSAYRELKARFDRIDYGFLGYSLVSPYPVCYDIRDADPPGLLATTQRYAVDHLIKLDGLFDFQRIVPYANGMRLLAASTLAMNRSFNRIDTLAEHLPPEIARKLYLAEPGQRWDERFIAQPLRFGYDTESIAEHFERAGVVHRYAFAATEPLSDEHYQGFFASYFQAIERKRGFDIDIVCRVTDSEFQPLKSYRYAGGHTRPALDDAPCGETIELELPCAWINEVLLGRMPMGALYFAFQFRARYPGDAVPFPWRVHRWS